MAESIAFDIAVELITKLSSFAVSQIGLWWNVKDDLDDLKTTVSTIKAVLLDAEEKSVTNNLVKVWLEKLKDVLYDADDLLDDFSTEALRKDLMGGKKLMKEVRLFFSSSNQFAYGLKIGQKIKAIKARLASIESKANTYGFMVRGSPVETSFETTKRQQTHSFVPKDKIIGRDDDKTALRKLVLEFESEENVYIIPIVGFGGLGKTALAQFVYNDKMVRDHFELKMWVCVSDVFDVKIIVENIIKSATGKAPKKNLEMDQLQEQLREKIGGKKYLLVLDDIWNEDWEEWVSLEELLIDGAKGSRIIVTTRSFKVAKITSKCQPHVLKGLSGDDAWSLFREIAFEQRSMDSTDLAFVQIGKRILERCGGVPLVIRKIASTLYYKKTEKEWRSFKDNELVRIIFQNESKILPTLKLSYDHLPSHLKHCFTFCRLYPKDYEIHVQTLVQIWIVQGFVKQLNPSQSLEDIGFGYFKDLVEKSFFQEVVGERYVGEGLKCKMHDLMHDLAVSIAGAESSIVDSNNITSEVGEKCRHISINASLIPQFRGKKLRTLLRSSNKGVQNFHHETWDFIISNCRRLRVLELYNLNLEMIPCLIHKLKHLRYLDLSRNRRIKTLPESICEIQNLQVLKLDFCSGLKELPKNIEKWGNLTHLGCKNCGLTHMPRGIGKLSSLETLSMFVVDKDGSHGGADLSELSGLNNLRGELIIRNLGFVKNAREQFKAANLKEKQHLRSLVLQWHRAAADDDEKSLEDLQPHPNLEELRIVGWRGDANFPNWPKRNQGEAESFFPSLKFLWLQNCPKMKSWWRTTKPIDDDSNEDDTRVMGTSTMAFPRLSTLWIVNCPLTSMPLYPSLEELKLVNTSSRPFKQTIKMNINAETPSTSTSSLPLSNLKSFTGLKKLRIEKWKEVDIEGMKGEYLKNLRSLSLANFPNLKSLPEWIQDQKNLLWLSLINFPKLTSLTDEMRCLTNLQELDIHGVPQLEERCEKDIGADWYKIAHIPSGWSFH
ncbi:putative disease resistance protein RGA1 [Gossypium arboreum]|uniref:putative disease resistance protein RGA1 n=1 Tax=Gossypium arboreum TaxID=29729 RepID=UPI0022F19CD3|nr:putative disease resistance protein RGA1 [Gossypium arboreum]